MSEYALRALVAIAIAAMLFVQARRLVAQSRRRRAFALAAGAFGLFALANGLALVGIGGGYVVLGGFFLGAIMLLLSLFMLFGAYRSGEMSDQMRRAQDMIAAERAKNRQPDKRKDDQQ